MGRLFGTDGVRGLANADLTPELALNLARAAAGILAAGKDRPTVVVGRDPRASGEMLEAAICAGLTSAGADVLRTGVLPTPAVAYLIAVTEADFGVMLSASHNPMPDNGIKLFAAGGRKLSDDVEDLIAAAVHDAPKRPVGPEIGRVRDLNDGVERYIEHLLSSTSVDLAGLKVVVDCANGAASTVAPEIYRRAGAEVVAICADADGLNINDGCGSTHLDVVRAAVAEHGADLGIAHDGDADRCLAVAADGTDVDGDQIMAVLAVAMKEAGMLANDTLVTTVMSNLGLHQAMRERGITLATTAVGDRYVLEELARGEHSLGGEQSGHIVLPAHATTGDGLLTALQLMARIAATGTPLAELAGIMTRAPQVLINVRVTDKSVIDSPQLRQRVTEHADVLGDNGRILLRPSGTEPLIRVMVEAATAEQARDVAEDIAAAVAA